MVFNIDYGGDFCISIEPLDYELSSSSSSCSSSYSLLTFYSRVALEKLNIKMAINNFNKIKFPNMTTVTK